MSTHAKADAAAIEKLYKQQQALNDGIATYFAKRKPEPVKDYELTASDGKRVKLSKFFGKAKSLVVIHNMGFACPFCTMWADGFEPLYRYLVDGEFTGGAAAFVLVSPDNPKAQKAGAKKRGWTFPMLSSQGSTFSRDMGYEQDGSPWPGMSTFYKKGGKIYRYAHSPFGPGDTFCSVWSFVNLLPQPKKK